MGDIWQLWVSVKVDQASLNKATSDIQKEFSNTWNKVENTLNKSIMWWLQAFASSQIATGLNKVAWWALTLAGNLEQADVAFTTMLWSAEKSKKMLKDLSDFASKTPFELTGIRQTAKQLLAYGIEAEKIMPTLKALWDVSAGLSVPIEQVAYAYGQVRSAGRLLGQDLRQFTNAWVPIIAELAKNLWVAESGIKDMVSAGKIWFADVEKAFQTMSWEWGKFANLMDKQSKTLLWSWSNFKDSMNTLWEVLGGLFTDSLTWVVTAITWIVNSIKDWAKEHPALAKTIATVVVALTWLISVLGVVTWIIWFLAPLFVALSGPIWLVIAWVSLLAGGLVWLNSKNWEVIDSTWKRTKELKKLQDEQQKLDEKLAKWKITQVEYEKQTKKNKDAQETFTRSIQATKTEAFNYWTAIEELAKKKLKLNSEEWIKERNEIQKNTQELIKNLRARLEIEKKDANEVLKKLQDEQKKNENNDQVWAGSMAWMDSVYFSQYGQKQAWISSLELQIGDAQKVINDFDKEYADAIKRINTSTKSLAWAWSWGGWLSESAKQLIQDQATVYKESFTKIEDELKKSSDRVDDYKKKVKEIGDEFTDMANKAKDELWNVNQSLSQLSTDYTNTQWSRYAEVIAQLATAESWSAEWSKLEQERQYLIWITTQAVRDQAVQYYNLSEAQKTTKKYEEDKLSLMEKQALLTALSTQTTSVDANWNTVLDQNLRVTATNQFEYEAEKWKRVAITDAKNIEYARDILNQQMKMQSELALTQQKIDQEYILQEDLNAKKMLLEADFTKFVNEQTAAQRKVVKGLIDDVQTAINMINTLNALNAKSKTSSSKWFMAWGYTWDWALGQEAGVVHAREYVLSNAMLTKLPGIVPALEAIRTWNIDNSRNVSMGSVIVQNQMDFEQLLDRIRFMHL